MSAEPERLVDEIGQFVTIPYTVIRMLPIIGADAFALFSVLRYHTNRAGRCFPGYILLSKETGLNRNRIARAIRTLEQSGLLTRIKRFGASTIYTLKLPRVIPEATDERLTQPTGDEYISHDSGLLEDECDEECAPLVTIRDYSSHDSGLSVVTNRDSNYINLTRLSLTTLTSSREEKKLVTPITEKKEGGSMPPDPKSAYLSRIERATSIGMVNAARDGDIGDYPDEVKPVIRLVCELWNLRAPVLRGRAKQSSQAAFWISAAKELLDSCGELGLEPIKHERERFVQHMKTHGGIAPYTVSGPKSLVNGVRAAAGELRTKAQIKEQEVQLPHGLTMSYLQSFAKAIQGASEVYTGDGRIK